MNEYMFKIIIRCKKKISYIIISNNEIEFKI